MDVTPRELRDIDIREGFRGYNRDDVDELLERAAATIEGLNERMRRLTEQVSSAEGQQGQSRETEDMLHRTLLLAQRAADEAVAEAQFKARQILDDAETKSRAQLAEAESAARRQVDTERRRLETEVIELGSRREALLADVDGLERFESEYRVRLRRAARGRPRVARRSGPGRAVGAPADPRGRGAEPAAPRTTRLRANSTPSSAPTAPPAPPLAHPHAADSATAVDRRGRTRRPRRSAGSAAGISPPVRPRRRRRATVRPLRRRHHR